MFFLSFTLEYKKYFVGDFSTNISAKLTAAHYISCVLVDGFTVLPSLKMET